MDPYPVGTKVRYHGSIEDRHGIYDITGVPSIREMRPDLIGHYTDVELAELYPDEVGYSLYLHGEPFRFGLMDIYGLHSVRRGSITPVED